MIKRRTNSKNIRKIDELNTAIACDDKFVLSHLLAKDIDLNCRGSGGLFPVMVAVEYGNVYALEALFQYGANPNTIDLRDGFSPLMKALSDRFLPNRYQIVKSLLKHGIDVNIISKGGKTALYLARLYQPRYVSMLKRFGAEF